MQHFHHYNFMANKDELHLEPRVAKLEAGLDILTRNVSDLTNTVNNLASNLDTKIEKLTVAVTEAKSPQKTDWSTIIAGVMLVLAIGSAVFWPLNQTTQESKQEILKLENQISSHEALNSHPVGMALINRLEEQAKTHREIDEKDREMMRTHFHEELDLVTKNSEQLIKAVESKMDLHNDRIYARVVKLEDVLAHDRNAELNELRLWRIRAMNHDNGKVDTSIIFDPHVPTKEEGSKGATP